MRLSASILAIAAAAASTTSASEAAERKPVERYVEAPGPQGPLKGTLLLPTGKAKGVVVILPGSGPTDRDGNSPAGVRAQPYKLLAEALAPRGLASVRIDKRGLFASAAAIADGNAVTVADYAADAHAWAKVARASSGASCAWIAGHSEGGLIALAAAQDPSDLCGIVLLAAPGRPIGEALRGQLNANPANAPLRAQYESAIENLVAGRKVDVSALHPALQQLFAPAVQSFLIDLFSYDPAKLARSVSVPMLILRGGSDLQALAEDAERLAAANPRARLVLLPDLNHVLKTVKEGDQRANLAAYGDPSLPLDPRVTEAVAGYILEQGRR